MAVLKLLLILPLIEIAGFVVIGPYLGVVGTIAFVVLSTFLGLSLLRNEGVSALRRLQRSIASGATPVPAALDGACRIVAALLLVVPGFISSALGALLFVPPIRRMLVRHLRARVEPNGAVVWRFDRTGSTRIIIDADYQEIRPAPQKLPGGDR
jgi:UPF0716 protein FxsA